jgi:hypothetical protein
VAKSVVLLHLAEYARLSGEPEQEKEARPTTLGFGVGGLGAVGSS